MFLWCTLLSLVIGVTREFQRQPGGTFIVMLCYVLREIFDALNRKTHAFYVKSHMIALFCFLYEAPWLYAVGARRSSDLKIPVSQYVCLFSVTVFIMAKN